MTSAVPRGITVACATLALAACAGAPPEAGRTTPRPAPGSQAAPSAIAQARADSARRPYTEADVRFMSGMIGHHAQAIAMAEWAPTHDAAPAVRTLAERIVNAQQDEIATMRQWLRDRRQPVPEERPAGMGMESGAGHRMLMPGMLPGAQMRELDQAKGGEFDRLFLTFMIQHHRGAVAMVKALFQTSGAAQDETVFKFANDVGVDQATEIARMEKMLAPLTPERPSQ